MIGLTGSHRVGKSTLAKTYADKHKSLFVETSVSSIFEELGFTASDTLTFSKRLDVQEYVLERVDAIYGCVPPGTDAIADRTPLDMLAYTMAEAIGSRVKEKDQTRFAKYVEDCFEVTNKRFSMVLLIQPAIELVPDPTKAVANLAYMEHLNSLILGLTADSRLKTSHFYIARQHKTIEDRMAALENAQGRTMQQALNGMQHHLEIGAFVH